MKWLLYPFILVACLFSLTGCKGQETYGQKYLQRSGTIPMPGVRGRIDHLDVNLKDGLVYVAALGNNTIEVADITNGKIIHHITGLNEPQGVCYIPATKEIMVANGGNGDCYFFNSTTWQKTATLQLGADADDVHYDSAQNKIYVGYGSGGIAAIDAGTHKISANLSLPCHPEGFQLDDANGKLYVNLQARGEVAVIETGELKLVTTWNKNHRNGNFPMALDARGKHLFVGYRHPGKLELIDTKNGSRQDEADLCADCDDLYYDATGKCVYASCGGGYVNIFLLQNDNKFKSVANIPTANGARTSILIPRLNKYIVAQPAGYDREAQLIVYTFFR
jgi:DNA-binding beta-propeller fold protein YncE